MRNEWNSTGLLNGNVFKMDVVTLYSKNEVPVRFRKRIMEAAEARDIRVDRPGTRQFPVDLVAQTQNGVNLITELAFSLDP